MENKKEGIIGIALIGLTILVPVILGIKTAYDNKKAEEKKKEENERKLQEEKEARQILEDYILADMSSTNYTDIIRHISIDDQTLDQSLRKDIFALGMKYFEMMKGATSIEYYNIYKDYILSLNSYSNNPDKLKIYVDYSIEKMKNEEDRVAKEKERQNSIKLEQMRINHEEEMKRLENMNAYDTQRLNNERDNRRVNAAVTIAKALKDPDTAFNSVYKLF